MALRSTSRPPIKGRVIPRVPATLQATDGLEVSKENGVWTFGHDWTQLSEGSVTDAANQQVLVFNDATGVFTRVAFQTVIDAGTGVIPSDLTPEMDGSAFAGSSALYSRGDHVHPSDTSKSDTGHTHTAANVTDFSEAVDDRVNSLLVAGTNVTLTYSDVANTMTIAASGGSSVSDGDKGDITVSGTGATWTIDNDAVTFAKMLNASSTSVLVGRGQGGGTGDFQQITLGSNISMTGTVLNVSSGTAVLGDGDYGDIVVSSSGTILTVDTAAVTFAKMQTIATDSLIGRDTASTGAPENITLGASLSMNGSGVLQRAALTGDVTASVNANATTIAANAVTNAKMATMNGFTLKGNSTGSSAVPSDISISALSTKTPTTSDWLLLSDTAASGALKKAAWPSTATDVATLDALAYNGLQINGSMEVDQPNAGASVAVAAGTVAQTHSADGWYVAKTGTNAFGIQQTTSVFTGYTKELKLTITTAQASIGSDTVDIRQAIEGYRIARLAWGTASAIPLTIGFWVKSSVSGTLGVLASNSTLATTATTSVTITSAAVAQFVTATFAAQTTGTWLTDNSAGIIISVRVAGTGSINIAATNGNTFEITGVVVLPGTQTITAAQSPLLMRPYGQELEICRRYWMQFASMVVQTNLYFGSLIFPVTMRAAPTITGGGAGFTNAITPSVSHASFFQTTGGYETITLDARL